MVSLRDDAAQVDWASDDKEAHRRTEEVEIVSTSLPE